MSNIIYLDHLRDDQILNDLLASLQLNNNSPREVAQRNPLTPPTLAPITARLSPSRPPIPSGSRVSKQSEASHSHPPFGHPVDPPRPLESPPPSPDFDPTDIALWENDPDINPLGPSERTYNVSVGRETGIIQTWYVSHTTIRLASLIFTQVACSTCFPGLSWRKGNKNQDRHAATATASWAEKCICGVRRIRARNLSNVVSY